MVCIKMNKNSYYNWLKKCIHSIYSLYLLFTLIFFIISSSLIQNLLNNFEYRANNRLKSIESFIDVSKVEVKLYADNSTGLSELYNKAIEESTNNPAILVRTPDSSSTNTDNVCFIIMFYQIFKLIVMK